MNDDKSINGGEAGNYITIDKLQDEFLRVELATINKALPGDSPDYPKNNKHYSLFDSIKFRLPSVQN